MKTCDECGKAFEPRGPRTEKCPTCRLNSYTRVYEPPTPIRSSIRSCTVCKGPMPKGSLPKQRVCSEGCRYEAALRAVPKRRSA